MGKDGSDGKSLDNVNSIVFRAALTKFFPAQLLGKAMNIGRKARDMYDAALAEYDVLIAPTVPFVVRTLPPENPTVLQNIAKGKATCLHLPALLSWLRNLLSWLRNSHSTIS